MSKISRIRVEKNRNYTTINNVFLRDMNLSLKAKGLLALIMSLPDDWDFSGRGIITQVKENETAVYSAINELIELGYCQRNRIKHHESGKFVGYEYEFKEQPYLENPNTDNPSIDNPILENQYKTNKGKKEEKNKQSKEGKETLQFLKDDSFSFQKKQSLPKTSDDELLPILKDCIGFYLTQIGGAVSTPNTHLNQFKEHSDYDKVIPTLLDALKSQDRQLNKIYASGKRPFAKNFSTYIFERGWEITYAPISSIPSTPAESIKIITQRYDLR